LPAADILSKTEKKLAEKHRKSLKQGKRIGIIVEV
jgi:hypothetical protein